DRHTYAPLIYEVFAALLSDDETVDDILVTFQEGLSARQLRPGRALVAWVNWINEDFHQPTLVRMIQEGLLEIPNTSSEEMSFSRLSTELAGIGIGFGRERYLPRLDEAITAIQGHIAMPDNAEEGRDESRRLALDGRLTRLRCLRDLIKR